MLKRLSCDSYMHSVYGAAAPALDMLHPDPAV